MQFASAQVLPAVAWVLRRAKAAALQDDKQRLIEPSGFTARNSTPDDSSLQRSPVAKNQ